MTVARIEIRFHTDSRRGQTPTVSSQVKPRVKGAFDAVGIEIYPTGAQIVQLQDGAVGPTHSVPSPAAQENAGPLAQDTPSAGVKATPNETQQRSINADIGSQHERKGSTR